MNILNENVVKPVDKKTQKKNNEDDLWIPLTLFTVLSLFMIIGALNLEKKSDNIIIYWVIIVATFIISSWVCLVALEKSKFTNWIWSFKSTSVFTGAFISVFVFFSSLKASALINEIFLVDAAAFTYTRVIASVLYAFSLFMPLFLLYLFSALLVLIKQMIWPSEVKNITFFKIIVYISKYCI